jgi:exopolyphosphatase / guanosine-5'-triphosphate,3'-diphosphate pyrophosphatase
MAGVVRAVIDVGTNSVKLLVGAVENGAVQPLHESSHQTRLGRGFYETHILQPGAILETARSVASFAERAASWKPVSIKVVATSAARDALNKEDLLNAISSACGLQVMVISGEQEADWAYRGVTTDPALQSQPLLVMDVGGGSTEFILGQRGKRLFGGSFPLGSVRLLERMPVDDPPTHAQLTAYEREIDHILESRVRPDLNRQLSAMEGEPQLVATGGTSTILGRVHLGLAHFDREKIDTLRLSRADLQREKKRLWNMPLDERRNIIGLPSNRADVILPGVLIFERVMQAFRFDSLRVSTRGIRFAALMEE